MKRYFRSSDWKLYQSTLEGCWLKRKRMFSDETEMERCDQHPPTFPTDHTFIIRNSKSIKDPWETEWSCWLPSIKRKYTKRKMPLEDRTRPSSRRFNWQEKLADEKKLRGKEQRKGRRSSSRGRQAKRYGTFRVARENTFWTLRSFAFPLFTWETRRPQQASA